ncbi:hypothetical protein [Corynebacterium mastitidis]|uniref:hypothetical protein n=1 Tax=Corynebacterium mastitidis TaxID=161890 RepID=UPI00254D751C|nr:hypothetical protein [Corynebacterium mastitidis]MDK8451500.1 hypothetical protein [Corynebacterium mastitidis]
MTSLLGFVLVLTVMMGPLLGGAGIALSAYRRREVREPRVWDGGRGPGWAMTMLLALLAGVAWMAVWYSWGGGPGHNQYPHWQVLCSVICVVASTAALGWWARWRLSGPLAAAVGSGLGVCLVFAGYGAATDSTGLWGVGLLFLIVGAVIGLLPISMAVTRLRGRGLAHGAKREGPPQPVE